MKLTSQYLHTPCQPRVRPVWVWGHQRVFEGAGVVRHVFHASRRPLVAGVPVFAPDVCCIITAEVLVVKSSCQHASTSSTNEAGWQKSNGSSVILAHTTYRLNHETHVLEIPVHLARRRPKQRRRQVPGRGVGPLVDNIARDTLPRPVPDADGLRGPFEGVDAAADGVEGVSVSVRVRCRGQVVAAGVVVRLFTVSGESSLGSGGEGGAA